MTLTPAHAIMLGAIWVAYWLPSIIAWNRHVTRRTQVAIINALTGWTLIGWVIALVMAADPNTTTKEKRPA